MLNLNAMESLLACAGGGFLHRFIGIGVLIGLALGFICVVGLVFAKTRRGKAILAAQAIIGLAYPTIIYPAIASG